MEYSDIVKVAAAADVAPSTLVRILKDGQKPHRTTRAAIVGALRALGFSKEAKKVEATK